MSTLPQNLQNALEAMLDGADTGKLAKDAQTISENYRERTGTGRRLLTRESEAAAYAAARMPATFAAIQSALEEALACSGLAPKSVLDCGAGTGAASWAADSLLELDKINCLEREAAMRSVGGKLMQAGDAALAGATWADWDLTKDEALPRAELVLEGYMLGELSGEMRLPAAKRLWDAAQEMLLLVEPGTPQGFENLRAVRESLVKEGAYVAAPCPAGTQECPMSDGDWCHFTVRVQRTRLHKALKGGEAPFEDEKFAYLALMRTPPVAGCAARVLRHPQIAPGRIGLTLCEDGKVKQRTVTKKDPLWKRARKIEAGDSV